jgi:CDGSH-type Zn-finger protein
MAEKPNKPWEFSNRYGYVTDDGIIRVYGFPEQPAADLAPGRIARRRPVDVELKPGQYRWCSCGHSQTQPFCDGAHGDRSHQTNRQGYKFQVLEETTVRLCLCKKTSNPPFCDCTHLEMRRPSGMA